MPVHLEPDLNHPSFDTQEHPESVPDVVSALLERYTVTAPAALRSGIALAMKACCNELEPEHVQRCLEFMLSQGLADADGQIWEQIVSAGAQIPPPAGLVLDLHTTPPPPSPLQPVTGNGSFSLSCPPVHALCLVEIGKTDSGYMSANLYDLQVEILFNGAADAMRRRILAPLKAGLQAFSTVPAQQLKVLDVACGTGRTLRMIRGALPKASLFGTDLSPAYLRKANQLLSEISGELPQLLQANSEELPYLDNYFHGLTSVFLFHELPAAARQQVINEAFRVLQPGGVFVICDSMQAIDSPDFQPMMNNFPAIFHEPYYRHYTTDNLEELLTTAGFTNIKVENHFVSKYWTAYKPA